MRANVQKTASFMVAAVVLFSAELARAGLEPEVSNDHLGQSVPEFQATTLDGKAFSLSDVRGKPVIVQFFASWCPPCQKVNRSLREIYPDYSRKGLTFVGVLADPIASPDTVPEARKTLKRDPLPYPVVLLNDSVKVAFGFKGFPATYFITQDGKFSTSVYGPHPTEKFRAITDEVLRQNAALAADQASTGDQGHASNAKLLAALSKSKHSLADGIRQAGAKAPEVAISAKFELNDSGQLLLSVYTAALGPGTDAEHNVFKELVVSAEAEKWSPITGVLSDHEHVSRASEQLASMALSKRSLLDVIRKAEKDHTGIVFSITPVLRDREAQFVVLVASEGKAAELRYDGMTGDALRANR